MEHIFDHCTTELPRSQLPIAGVHQTSLWKGWFTIRKSLLFPTNATLEVWDLVPLFNQIRKLLAGTDKILHRKMGNHTEEGESYLLLMTQKHSVYVLMEGALFPPDAIVSQISRFRFYQTLMMLFRRATALFFLFHAAESSNMLRRVSTDSLVHIPLESRIVGGIQASPGAYPFFGTFSWCLELSK